MANQPHRVQAMGMAWYRADTFDRVRNMMVDAHLLAETYEKFLYSALKGEEKMRGSGITVIRVHLDEHDFPAYCASKGLALDAKGRMDYAAFKAMQAVRQRNEPGHG